MAFVNSSFQEIHQVWLQVWLQTNTTTSSKKINMTTWPFAFGLWRLYVFHFTFPFFHFFFFSARMNSNCTVHAHGFTVQETKCIVHCTQNHFVQKTNIKNRYHGTIHSFKNYFVTVFSVFSFQLNKLYPNRPYIFRKSNH